MLAPLLHGRGVPDQADDAWLDCSLAPPLRSLRLISKASSQLQQAKTDALSDMQISRLSLLQPVMNARLSQDC